MRKLLALAIILCATMALGTVRKLPANPTKYQTAMWNTLRTLLTGIDGRCFKHDMDAGVSGSSDDPQVCTSSQVFQTAAWPLPPGECIVTDFCLIQVSSTGWETGDQATIELREFDRNPILVGTTALTSIVTTAVIDGWDNEVWHCNNNLAIPVDSQYLVTTWNSGVDNPAVSAQWHGSIYGIVECN